MEVFKRILGGIESIAIYLTVKEKSCKSMKIKIAWILLIAAIAIAVHQLVTWGVVFEFDDLHHETWIVMFGFAGLILLIKKK